MGPLSGIKVIELGGIGPGPFCGMILSDLGAEVVRIERPNVVQSGRPDGQAIHRGRRSIGVDLKNPEGVETILSLVEKADVFYEGFRPGVAERNGLGPDVLLERNPAIVYGRMTGWGQDGPMAQAAGHDINYIALSGALDSMGRAGEKPVPPLNMVGDFGGGGAYLAIGILAALVERQSSGKGQVIDAAMVDGAAHLMTMFYGLFGQGAWSLERGTNNLDSGAHYYETYETSDGKHVALGSIEPQFYAEFLARTGLDKEDLPDQNDREKWPLLKERLTNLFLTKTRDEWTELLEGTDSCFAPVLSLEEAPKHPHNVARSSFVEVGGIQQAAPAPRFSRTVPGVPNPPAMPGSDTDTVLTDWGLGDRIAALRGGGAIA